MYRVNEPWTASYPDPIALTAGENLTLAGKTEVWNGSTWLWARDIRGKEGWIPDTLVTTADGQTRAARAFDAMELSCKRGELLTGIEETHGWVLCRSENETEGWVPAENLVTVTT